MDEADPAAPRHRAEGPICVDPQRVRHELHLAPMTRRPLHLRARHEAGEVRDEARLRGVEVLEEEYGVRRAEAETASALASAAIARALSAPPGPRSAPR